MGRYRRSMSVRWYLPSCHLHLKKKIWRKTKHKDPSCRLRDTSEKKKDGKKRNTKNSLAGGAEII